MPLIDPLRAMFRVQLTKRRPKKGAAQSRYQPEQCRPGKALAGWIRSPDQGVMHQSFHDEDRNARNQSRNQRPAWEHQSEDGAENQHKAQYDRNFIRMVVRPTDERRHRQYTNPVYGLHTLQCKVIHISMQERTSI